MYEAKTKPTAVTLKSYLATIADAERRKDCETLAAMMQRVTGSAPTMWGASIVGFDKYHYKYDSGHEGESCVVGFSSRKGDISVYLMGAYGNERMAAMLAKLGRHKMGKACLYIRRLSDVELPILEQLVQESVTDTRRRYAPATNGASAERAASTAKAKAPPKAKSSGAAKSDSKRKAPTKAATKAKSAATRSTKAKRT